MTVVVRRTENPSPLQASFEVCDDHTHWWPCEHFPEHPPQPWDQELYQATTRVQRRRRRVAAGRVR